LESLESLEMLGRRVAIGGLTRLLWYIAAWVAVDRATGAVWQWEKIDTNGFLRCRKAYGLKNVLDARIVRRFDKTTERQNERAGRATFDEEELPSSLDLLKRLWIMRLMDFGPNF
jgi:hypothetical protein